MSKTSSFFDQNRTIWVIVNKIADVLFVALLWFVFSIPVITIGASSTAAYYVYMKMARNEDGYIWRNFWKSFKMNFVQATVLWLVQAVLLVLLIGTAYFYYSQGDKVSAGIMAFLMGMLLIVVIVCIYLPPIVCRFSNTTWRLLTTAVFMPFKAFKWTCVLVVLFAVFAFLAWFIIPFIIVAYGVYAFVSARVFVKIFEPYEKAIKQRQGIADEDEEDENE